jgi:hypothetical protein
LNETNQINQINQTNKTNQTNQTGRSFCNKRGGYGAEIDPGNGVGRRDSLMVSAANRSIALPVGSTYRFGLVANWLKSPKVKLGFSYEVSYMGDLSVNQYRGPLAGQLTGAYKDAMMHFFAFTVNWGSQGVTFGPGDSGS